jgi:hypothetical protein
LCCFFLLVFLLLHSVGGGNFSSFKNQIEIWDFSVSFFVSPDGDSWRVVSDSSPSVRPSRPVRLPIYPSSLCVIIITEHGSYCIQLSFGASLRMKRMPLTYLSNRRQK